MIWFSHRKDISVTKLTIASKVRAIVRNYEKMLAVPGIVFMLGIPCAAAGTTTTTDAKMPQMIEHFGDKRPDADASGREERFDTGRARCEGGLQGADHFANRSRTHDT